MFGIIYKQREMPSAICMYLVIRRAETLINKLAATAKCIRREPDKEVIKP
jgi:hypothetical protein